MKEDVEEAAGRGRLRGPEPVEHGGIEELYRRHAPEAVRLAYLLTGNAQVAQDLAQDAFVRLGWHLLHLRRADAFGAYLRKTVVNLARTHFRRERTERAAVTRNHTPVPYVGADVADQEAVRSALRILPHRQRIAVVLRFYEDLSYEQIADTMRCRVGTVGSLLSRAMETLRSEMEVE
jgi:RNA polymerase sigma-70 factor (sigma-E family)